MNRNLVSTLSSASLLAAIGVGASLGLAGMPASAADASKAPSDLVARGKYLVNTSGCHDCHTPFKWDRTAPSPT